MMIQTARARCPRFLIPFELAALSCAPIVFAAASAPASTIERSVDWVEIASEAPDDPARGHRVFERSVPGSTYKAYRIEALVDAPPERALAATRVRILDPRYVGEGRERRVIGRHGDAWILYFRARAPMIDDREAVTRVEETRTADGSIGLHWRSTDLGPQPSADAVRMPRSEGSWSFRAAGDGRSLAVYESFSELGGHVPAWIVNRLMVGEQLRELETLRAVLAEHDDRKLAARLARLDGALPSVGAGPAE